MPACGLGMLSAQPALRTTPALLLRPGRGLGGSGDGERCGEVRAPLFSEWVQPF